MFYGAARRCVDESGTVRMMARLCLMLGVLLCLSFHGFAAPVPSKPPRLVASGVLNLAWLCGPNGIINIEDGDKSYVQVWREYVSGRSITLAELPRAVGIRPVALQPCSPDGHWALTVGPHYKDIPSPGNTLRLYEHRLWDVNSGKPYVIGFGADAFRWSSDSKRVIYAPDCSDTDCCPPAGTAHWKFNVPKSAAVVAISVYDLLRQADIRELDGPDRFLVGGIFWLDTSSLILIGQTCSGRRNQRKELSLYVSLSKPTPEIAQLQPGSDQERLSASIKQMSLSDTQAAVSGTQCRVENKRLLCRESENVPVPLPLSFDVDAYCATLTPGASTNQFCSGQPAGVRWREIHRSDHLLVAKFFERISGSNQPVTNALLFLIPNSDSRR